MNLQEKSEEEWNPEVFFVPSKWVAEFVKSDWSRFMYFLPKSVYDTVHERWDLVQSYLAGTDVAITWANDWPEDKLVKWGTETE